MNQQTLSFLIHWVPTLLFLVGLLFATLVGFIRGLRKSVILCIHAAALATVLLIVFLIISGKTSTDPKVFAIVETFMGKGKIQSLMGVSADCNSFTDCFIEFIPKQMNQNEGLELILRENGQYLATLASMAARMVLALLLWIVYLILLFILFLIYLIFYPVHRHVRKLRKAHNKKQQELPEEERKPFCYKKRRGFGALVGGLRGLVGGLVGLSFLGSLFFIIAGGTGSKKMETMDWGNESTNLAYGAYSEIESYGTEGIFKVLNAMKDKENSPFYLFAADLVFRGDLVDEERELNQNVYLRKELAVYTEFSKDTLNLIIRIGGEEFREYVKNPPEGKTIMDGIIEVMSKQEFKDEFIPMIENFKQSTYFINLSYSLICSFVNHLEQLDLASSMGEETVSLIQLLFKKGYYAEQIPYEKYLKETNSNIELGYLTPDVILNPHDAAVLTNVILDVLYINKTYTEDAQLKTLTLIKTVLPHISNLTILSSEESENTDAVLARLYQYVQCTYFKKTTEDQLTALKLGAVENPYTDSKYAKVSWVSEIKGLINTVADIISLYANVYVKDASVLENLFNIFDEKKATYTENIDLYNDIQKNVGSSFLLGDILAGEYGQSFLEDALKSISPNIDLPKIQYSNVMDDNGNIITKGEFYYLLEALKAFGSRTENKQIFTTLSKGEFEDTHAVYDLIKSLADALCAEDKQGNSVIDSVLSSTLFNCILSEIMISSDFGGSFTIYVDESILMVEDGVTVHRIQKEELKQFFFSIGNVVTDLASVDANADISTLLGVVLSKTMYDALESKIIEGTISNFIANNVSGNEFIVIPDEITQKTGLISKDGNTSEVKHLVGLYSLATLKITELTKEYASSNDQMNGIVGMLKGMSEEDMMTMFDSKILYYSMSKYMQTHATGFLGDADLIIPNTVLTAHPEESALPENSSIDKTILADMFHRITAILPEDMGNIDFGQLVNKMIGTTGICNNLILSASVTNLLLNGSVATTIDGILTIPSSYKAAGTQAMLRDYSTSNTCYIENLRFFPGLDAMIGPALKNGLTITGDSDALSNAVYDSFKELNKSDAGETETHLAKAYASSILSASISKRIDEIDLLDEADKADVKDGAIYREEEIASLVDLINVFALDMKSSSLLETAMSTATVSKLLETPEGATESNLDRQYNAKITPLILTKGIRKTQTDELLPTDSMETDERFIKKSEAKALLEALTALNLNLNSFSVADDLSTSTIRSCMFESDAAHSLKSVILLQSVSEAMMKFDTIIIPTQAFDSNKHGTTKGRLVASEVYDLFIGTEALGLGELKSDVSSLAITQGDEDLVKVAASSILRATITKNLKISNGSVEQTVRIKKNPVDTYVSLTTYTFNGVEHDTAILSQTETVNVLKSIKILAGGGSVNNVNLSMSTIANMNSSDREVLLTCAVTAPIISDLIRAVPFPTDYTTVTLDTNPGEEFTMVILDTLADVDVTLYSAAQMEDYFTKLSALLP